MTGTGGPVKQVRGSCPTGRRRPVTGTASTSAWAAISWPADRAARRGEGTGAAGARAGGREGGAELRVDFLQPTSWDEALAIKASRRDALPIAGGTDALLDLTMIPELAQWSADNGRIRLGACVSYTRIIEELGGRLPGLAMAAR